MSRVLAAALPLLVDEHLEHVAVADAGAREGDAHLAEPALEREVGHQRADHAAREAAARLAMLHDRIQQLVPVEERAVPVGHREAVAVAVEGDAEVSIALDHGARERLRMRGTAT